MDDHKHTCVFCIQFLVHLQKGQFESKLHQTKKSTLHLVRTKASEQADFPGVKTPYGLFDIFCHLYSGCFKITLRIVFSLQMSM